MARFKKETFTVHGAAGNTHTLEVSVLLSADGIFYANLPDYLADVFGAIQSPMVAGRAPEGTFRVSAATYIGLADSIQAGLSRFMHPEITEVPVIRYNIESHVSFATDDAGNIYPNAGFAGAKWGDTTERKLYGDHHATACPRGGYSLIIGARAMLRREYRHGEHVKVSYENYYAGGSHLGHENPAQLLNSWTAMNLGDTPKEIPYSDKAALFFHSLLLGMATLNQKIQLATFDQERLLGLIEQHGAAPLIGLAPLDGEE